MTNEQKKIDGQDQIINGLKRELAKADSLTGSAMRRAATLEERLMRTEQRLQASIELTTELRKEITDLRAAADEREAKS